MSCARCSSKAARRTPTLSAGSHSEELGKPGFRFLLTGIGGARQRHAGEGVLALERYVVRFPTTTAPGWSWRAAYFVLGELVRARGGVRRPS